MNAFLTVIPLILIRYGILSIIDKESLKRAGFFAPLIGREKVAFWVYQITTVLILLYPLLLKIKTDSDWFYIGLGVYSLGIILYAVSIVNYAKPKMNGINLNGLYRVSRNPMYIAYFIYFLGCALLTHSLILLALLICFQVSAHWIILSEERWCIKKFGEEYIKYMNKVRRYI
ncbi:MULTISPECIES: methyltransferase family protein [Clostridium]|jgi:protein-S-isoprenylcysteine O-methyltransferase Ste14|uniref:Isoprenylcysteine carboxylmethyltransferase family protein n=2 Tax=Clostridium beijerinckii TaxID=1520 RepID=A0AB74VAJ0_CLOBE|nr:MULTISPECIES: isoprenylcysteine carboxylmethyltransferase family protein [Clostridium]ALB45724.1 isoprenylcysteine carboxylmethyltransferase family protein [Clostridium beijerinckii NRRL B-598]AVK47163.1 phospholipid methyltransferase [Clostridium sp. MF28]MBC2460541.1 isoprenylcysteine carboxylmethyltransferase family protein [Clostridium beijerinckii]MBC2478096.1 isoprenylcysteine carboxylmethyltransferase family protein [Clostridium beijerinckii]MCI1578780.1 isoprenylcysteine carboxylmet